jgi:hypothetical protein
MMIDSELVPWGKGEKHPGEGDEIVSETIYLQGVGALCYFFGNNQGDGVPIEEWANEFAICCSSKFLGTEVEWKRGWIARI